MAHDNAEAKVKLLLQGNCTNHIWLMKDGKPPHTIGLRMDCGDGGVVYLTEEQARDLIKQLINFTTPTIDQRILG